MLSQIIRKYAERKILNLEYMGQELTRWSRIQGPFYSCISKELHLSNDTYIFYSKNARQDSNNRSNVSSYTEENSMSQDK